MKKKKPATARFVPQMDAVFSVATACARIAAFALDQLAHIDLYREALKVSPATMPWSGSPHSLRGRQEREQMRKFGLDLSDDIDSHYYRMARERSPGELHESGLTDYGRPMRKKKVVRRKPTARSKRRR